MKNKKITIDYETYQLVYTYLLGFERSIERNVKRADNPKTKEIGTSLINNIQELLEVLEKEAANV